VFSIQDSALLLGFFVVRQNQAGSLRKRSGQGELEVFADHHGFLEQQRNEETKRAAFPPGLSFVAWFLCCSSKSGGLVSVATGVALVVFHFGLERLLLAQGRGPGAFKDVAAKHIPHHGRPAQMREFQNILLH
jgi:hypothetical protein